MGDSLTGSTKETTKPPAWFTDAAKTALAEGQKVARIGYVPYTGPDVAAFSPQQVDAMQQAADWSAAFMTPGQAAPRVSASLMPSTDFGGGLKGYSSGPEFIDQIAKLRDTYPGLYKYISSFFIDPVTGKYPGTGTPGIPGGDPNAPPPVTPPPVTPPPVTPPPAGGGGGGPPPIEDRVPGMQGILPNGNRWSINANGKVVVHVNPNVAIKPGAGGGLGNFAARASLGNMGFGAGVRGGPIRL